MSKSSSQPTLQEQPGDIGVRDTNSRASSQVARVRERLAGYIAQRDLYRERCGDAGKVLVITELHPISFNARNSFLQAGDQGTIIGTSTDNRPTVKAEVNGQFKDIPNPRQGESQYRVEFAALVDNWHFTQTGKIRSLVEFVYVDEPMAYLISEQPDGQVPTPLDDQITNLEAMLHAFEQRD